MTCQPPPPPSCGQGHLGHQTAGKGGRSCPQRDELQHVYTRHLHSGGLEPTESAHIQKVLDDLNANIDHLVSVRETIYDLMEALVEKKASGALGAIEPS